MLVKKERRKHRRFYYSKPCWCEGNDITMYITISNISKGGFFLRTSNPLPIGKHAILTFRPVESSEIVCQVEVVWHARGPQVIAPPSISGMGTKLLDIVKGDEFLNLCLEEYE